MKNLEKRIWISKKYTIGQWINESIKTHSKKTAIVDGRTRITYTKALEHLIEQPDIWNKKIEFVEANSFPERYENITTLGKTKGYIHDKVFLNMEKKSKNIAVFETDTHKSITYQELQIKVENLSWTLIEAGVHKEDKVGIYLPKGSSQIVAVLAILGIGACYVPIGVNQPLQRMKGIFYRHFQVMRQPDCNFKRGITFSTFDAAYSLAAGTYGFSQICLNEIPFFTNIF